MKKNLNLQYLIIIFIGFQLVVMPGMAQNDTAFVNSFWNTLGFGKNNAITDWSEAGKIDFSILDYSGLLYLKNDFNSLYIGVRIYKEITEDIIWRINFDVDSDGVWAEDAKVVKLNGEPDFSYDDEYYIQNHPQAFPDQQSDNFAASMRTFTSVGRVNTIFELKIPLQTNDQLHDLQVQNPETTIIGLSMDVFLPDTDTNGTWRGGPYPNFANASNYIHILFAGPQDRRIPVFEEEEEPVPTTPPPQEETTEFTETMAESTETQPEAAAGASFEVWIALLGLFITTFILIRHRRRRVA
ncbi:MAG: hypothetical protein ACFE98_17280 [Candidatus Hermodarchaeota archaeon]